MIDFFQVNDAEPYSYFKILYDEAYKSNQKNIEAINVSSYSKINSEVNSRIVNIKFVKGDKFYFFSNYESPKSIDFENHNQVACIFYWHEIDVQIRIKGMIEKISERESDEHFKKRNLRKNILAISSNQSKKIKSYENVLEKYNETFNKYKKLDQIKRPSYWGGFCIRPYEFEFWRGHESRINKREHFIYEDNLWIKSFLEP